MSEDKKETKANACAADQEAQQPKADHAKPQVDLSAPEELSVEVIAELQKKADERDDFLDMLQRTRADYLNYQKRTRKERDQAAEFAVQGFFVYLAPIVNGLDMAIKAGERSHNLNAFFEGVKIVQAQLYRTLAETGIQPIETVGKPFDPAYHEAVKQVETANHAENTIVEELQRGFTMKGRTVLPARVVVAKHPKPSTPPAPEDGAKGPETSGGEKNSGQKQNE